MKTSQGRIKFAEYFTGVCELFDKKYSEALLDIYYKSLKDNSINEVELAFKQAIMTCNFFPKPAKLREFIPSQKKISAETKAQIEADKIISWANKFGGTKTPEFSDPVTKYLMTYRWPYQKWASERLTSDTTWWVKDFIKAYTSYVESGNVPQLEAPTKVLKLIKGIGGD